MSCWGNAGWALLVLLLASALEEDDAVNTTTVSPVTNVTSIGNTTLHPVTTMPANVTASTNATVLPTPGANATTVHPPTTGNTTSHPVRPTSPNATVITTPHTPDPVTHKPTSKPPSHRSTFDAASFIGGIVLVLGLQAVIFFLYKFCKSKEQNYHTL
ncbi:sialomucin core protein 24 [Anolis carolinensis]|uniref:CD164 molecule n=1 Tax=Anolis carolinensis TaxID=28377 RepID=A0A803TD01_ANOCA|nr:PREDICTED: sialomucin core protein 24 [Anolis carolinensis]|eukprot:XP_003215663.1 PREDICTED: sialomucin core protein 24 [Anolis carolinensis]